MTEHIVNKKTELLLKEKYIKHALRLALKAKGKTSPNPVVGAVLVKNGEIIGEGYHKKAGKPHAEINAIKAARGREKGADLYVTLEPCCHFNRTPPCTDAIIKSGIKNVIVGMIDPNPLVAGKGIKKLREAGIPVTANILEDKCRAINEIFIKYITTKKPFVILKAGMSIDGKIATSKGESKWITNELSRKIVHKMRDSVDAVLVGVNTVIKDDPELTVRLGKTVTKQPKRIILDSRLQIPLHMKILNTKNISDTILITTKNAYSNKLSALEEKGCKVFVVDSDEQGRVNISSALLHLGAEGITSILVEGGGEVNASFLASREVDKVVIFIGGMIIGGKNAPSPVGGMGTASLSDAMKIKITKCKLLEGDMMLEGDVIK